MELNDLNISFGEKVIFSHADFFFPEAGVTFLGGESGIGKTTLLRALFAQYPDCAFLFQEDRLLPWRTAAQHITDVLPKGGGTAEKWLKIVELEGEGGRYPAELSGGMRRRLALGRCLALGGRAYLLDEPFAGVDEERSRRILARLRDLGTPVVLTGHSPELKQQCDHIIEL